MQTAFDFTRIPEPYRARVERAMDEAAEAVHMRRTRSLQGPADAEADQAARAVLARYLEIADEADAAVEKMRDEDPGQCSYPSAYLHVDESERETRAEVWRARMAEVEAKDAVPMTPGATLTEIGGLIGYDESRWPARLLVPGLTAGDPSNGTSWEGEIPAAAQLNIDDDAGLRMVLDALVRYLADNPGEALRAIAALVNATPHSGYPMVSLGTTERTGFDMLAALGSKVRAIDSTRPDHMLEYATHEVDGVRFDAAHTRPMTDEERARAAREACTGVSASWCPVHGDCRCPRLDTGEREEESTTCPLHGEKSTHGDDEERAQAKP
jgi:hypothetical protein